MKLLSYNILSGGFNGYDTKTTHPERLDLIIKIIKQTNADIVSLIDTFRWDELYSNEHLAKIFNYKHAFCINLNDDRLKALGHNNGITVLSNIENTTFENVSLKTRNAIHAKIRVSTTNYDLFSIYLDDLKENVRLEQIYELKKHFKDDAPTLIMGDLNTFSPSDITTSIKTVNNFLVEKPKYMGLKTQLEDMARAETIKLLNSYGFKDAAVEHELTYPTLLPKISEKPLVRLDYCLYKSLNIKHFEIIKSELTEQASDHYPVLVEI